jgi:hypothetical protein
MARGSAKQLTFRRPALREPRSRRPATLPCAALKGATGFHCHSRSGILPANGSLAGASAAEAVCETGIADARQGAAAAADSDTGASLAPRGASARGPCPRFNRRDYLHLSYPAASSHEPGALASWSLRSALLPLAATMTGPRKRART